MATKQRTVHHFLVAVFCMGVLTVALTFRVSGAAGQRTRTPPSPVQVQNVGGGAATAVGQPASHLVDLSCEGVGSGPQVPCVDVNASTFFSVPSGEAFILTDMTWIRLRTGQPTGTFVVLTLTELPSNRDVFDFEGQTDSNGTAAGQVDLTTGIVIGPGKMLALGLGPKNGDVGLSIQGYLVPNQ